MQRDTLALFMSLIALIISVFYFLSFYAFRNSRMIEYDHEKLYLNKSRTWLCDDINNKNTCKYLFYGNKMLSLGENNNGDNLYLNKNTLICDDVNDLSTCSCLSNKCDFIKRLNHITFIDNPTAFTDSRYGMQYGGKVIPMESKNTFTFVTWININMIDLDKWRSILTWRKSEYEVNPAILISPKDWSSCSNKIDIRFKSLYDNSNENRELSGTFNVVEGNHGHCIRDTSYNYFKWFHLAIVGNNNIIRYYINGNLVQEETLTKNLELGDEEDKIYIGGSPEHSAEGIMMAKTRWYSKPLNMSEINTLFKEDYE